MLANRDSPCENHTFMVWVEMGKSAEEGVETMFVGETGELEAH